MSDNVADDAVMVALIPDESERSQLTVGGDDFEDLHVTVRYYGRAGDLEDGFYDVLHQMAATFAEEVQPFVVEIAGTDQLGEDDPPADVLLLKLSPDLQDAYESFPEAGDNVKKYPEYKPHMTIGYGVGERVTTAAVGDGAILISGIAVSLGNDDWTIYPLGVKVDAIVGAMDSKQREKWAQSGVALDDGSYPVRDQKDLANAIQAIGRAGDRTKAEHHIAKRARTLGLTKQLPDWLPATAGLEDPLTAAVTAAAKRDEGGGGGKKKKRKHICDLTKGGNPATCGGKVRWQSMYTALRHQRGMSKQKAAMIANANFKRWIEGRPMNRHSHHPIIRKAFP